MPNQLKELRAKIIKAMPEIVELKFGCFVKWKNDLNSGIESGIYLDDEIGDFVRCYMKSDEASLTRGVVIRTKKELEIIGRPITLEDILITLPGPGEIGYKRFTITITDDNIAFIDDNDDGNYVIKWQLGHHLESQSSETIKYLNEII